MCSACSYFCRFIYPVRRPSDLYRHDLVLLGDIRFGRPVQRPAEKYEEQSDNMRSSIEKLTKQLHSSTEYIKQSEYTGKLEERNRLSQAIHDKIGHSMTGALIQMEAAKRMLGSHPDKAAELLQNAITISKEGIEDIRITLKNMKPPAEQMGIHRLRTFIDEFSAKNGMPVPFTHQGDLDRLTQMHWRVIQENVTEALTNAMKYADATQIFIDIHVLNKAVKAEVKDNGNGAVRFKRPRHARYGRTGGRLARNRYF